MIIPIRCFSCGKVIGDKWEPFVRREAAGEAPKAVPDDLSLDRYCCRRMILSHVEPFDEILKFSTFKQGAFEWLLKSEAMIVENKYR